MERVLIAGASVGGLSAARELRRSGFEGVIQLVDQEPEAPYRRPAVSKGVLTGENTPESVRTPWPEDLELEFLPGLRLLELDLEARCVTAEDASSSRVTLPFDGLVLATGSIARPSPFGSRLERVFTLRSLRDGIELREALLDAERLVIIGGGFIGLEVAASARHLGVPVTVLEAAAVPLAHALGSDLGTQIAQLHSDSGVEIACGASVASLDGAETVESVSLADGTRLEADTVLVAVGSAPAVDWLQSSGLEIENGVVCDSTCAAVGATDVVVLGDIANWHNPLYDRRMRVEHWTNAIEQGTYAARRLLGTHVAEGFSSAPYFWSDQFDAKIQSIGSTAGHDAARVLEQSETRTVVAYGFGGRLLAVAGINGGAAVPRFRRLVEQGVPMDSLESPAPVGDR
jgi:NADPH-dependent 2,4-dienoyl-CoA reductase/sulfur reductase-like enzyme